MNCNKFLSLDPPEQASYLGSVIHAIMSDDEIFDFGKNLVDMGVSKGLFDRVKIGSEAINESETIS